MMKLMRSLGLLLIVGALLVVVECWKIRSGPWGRTSAATAGSLGSWDAVRRALAVAATASALLLSPMVTLAVVDCQSDCVKNCLIAAPGSADYCKSSCTDYCEDPEREDGLSGSKSASKGETGIFGGSIDGTTVKDLPPRSPVNFIDPQLSSAYGKSKSRMSAAALHQ